MCQAEQDKTLKKLIHLLRQIMHDAGYAIISNESDDSRLFCIEQYNRIYTRLMEVDRALASVFAPLAPDSSSRYCANGRPRYGEYADRTLTQRSIPGLYA